MTETACSVGCHAPAGFLRLRGGGYRASRDRPRRRRPPGRIRVLVEHARRHSSTGVNSGLAAEAGRIRPVRGARSGDDDRDRLDCAAIAAASEWPSFRNPPATALEKLYRESGSPSTTTSGDSVGRVALRRIDRWPSARTSPQRSGNGSTSFHPRRSVAFGRESAMFRARVRSDRASSSAEYCRFGNSGPKLSSRSRPTIASPRRSELS